MSPRALLAFCGSLPLCLNAPVYPLAWVKGVYTRSANDDTVPSPQGGHQGLNSPLPPTAVPHGLVLPWGPPSALPPYFNQYHLPLWSKWMAAIHRLSHRQCRGDRPRVSCEGCGISPQLLRTLRCRKGLVCVGMTGGFPQPVA